MSQPRGVWHMLFTDAHEFELPGEDAIIRKDGHRLILEPAPSQSLLAVLSNLPTLEQEFPRIEDPPPDPVDL